MREAFELLCFYCDLVLFHPIVIHTCPPFILLNYAPTHDPPRGKRRGKRIRNRIEILAPYVPLAYLEFPVFLLSERGKLRKPSIPPTRAAVKLQFPAFHLSERRKTGKATLPPMKAAVKLQLQVFLISDGGKLENDALPPMNAAVKQQQPLFLLSEWRKT